MFIYCLLIINKAYHLLKENRKHSFIFIVASKDVH